MARLNSGVYMITNLANGHRYIGSSSNLSKRREEHFRLLRKGEHHNDRFQKAWNRYGEASFAFAVILYCDRDELTDYEQQAIDGWRPDYNISPTAGCTLGVVPSEEARQRNAEAQRGRKHSEETREKISKAASERWQRTDEEERKEHMRSAQSGKHPASAETRQKMSLARKGKAKTEAHRKAIGQSNLGKHGGPLSEEHRRAIGAGVRRYLESKKSAGMV